MAQEKVLSSCMHLNQFISWKLDPNVARKVEHTCFGKFLALLTQKQIKQNLNMITAIVHFYSEADGCFSFRGQSKKNFLLDIGLEDILYITGLPINGIQVSGVESEDVVAIIQQHLGLDENGAKALFMEKGDKKCFGIHLNKLKNRFQTVPEGTSDLELEPYVKAYLLFLLGVVIFPNSSRVIAAMYLPLLELGSIDNYAWGAAALAVLKHSVASAKKKMIQKRVTSTGGFTYALMVFALERFPCLREGFPRSTTFPLFLGWTEILSLPFKDTQNLTTVDQYREKLENMKKDHVDWQPYGLPERVNILPHDCKSQSWMIYAYIPCLKKKDMRHMSNIRIKLLKYQSQHKNKNWKALNKKYKDLNNLWRKRDERLVKMDQNIEGDLINDEDDEASNNGEDGETPDHNDMILEEPEERHEERHEEENTEERPEERHEERHEEEMKRNQSGQPKEQGRGSVGRRLRRS
ncbi:hypothetical protein OROGR_024750 [Orobanche gracilis]